VGQAQSLGPVRFVAEAALPVAFGVGWLLGPPAGSRDRWTAAGAGIAAAVLGIALGSFVVAGVASVTVTKSVAEAVVFTLVIGVLGVWYSLLGSGAMLLAALPIAAVWVLLVQALTRAWPGGSAETTSVELAPIRGRIPPKGRRRRAAKAA
jgi:hypothetical protein